MSADDHAVVVGIANYPLLDPLNGPENDARDFAAWLQEPTGGAMPAENIDCILSSDPIPPGAAAMPEPTTVKLDGAFERIIDRSKEHGGRGGRRLYVYLAGHGFAPTIHDVVLLMANATKGRTGHHLAGRMYADWFRKAAYFDELVLFMDCCREHYPRIPVRPPPWEELTSRQLSNYFYGYANQWSGPSREGAYGPEGEVRGLFTLALLAGLRSANRDSEGRLTGSTLQGFVFSYMQQLAPAVIGTNAQEPEFDYPRNNEIVFATTGAPTTWTVHVELSPANRGKQVELIGGELQVIPPAATGPAGWEWKSLRDGLYRIHLDGSGADPLELIGAGGVMHVTI